MNTKGMSILGACIIVAALVVSMTRAQSPTREASPPAGRFQFGSVPGHAYVLDTATGQVWEKFATESQGSTDPNFNEPKLGRDRAAP